jgi:hypothetical protein
MEPLKTLLIILLRQWSCESHRMMFLPKLCLILLLFRCRDDRTYSYDDVGDVEAPVKSRESSRAAQQTPFQDVDEVSMDDIQLSGQTLNAHFSQQIQELTSSINEHEIG